MEEVSNKMLVSQSQSQPGEILAALKSLASSEVTELRIAVAYVTLSGCHTLLSDLSEIFGDEKWGHLNKTIVTSIDYGLTQPAALRYLKETEGFEVRVAGAHMLEQSNLIPTSAFHSKFFAFLEQEHCSVLTGSANLTAKALTINTETVWVERQTASFAMIDKTWASLLRDSVLLTDNLQQRYEYTYQSYATTSEPEDELISVDLPSVNSLKWFWKAVEDGDTEPLDFNAFWVEAGSMSSGGSHNQLELPRGANQFFDFSFGDYQDEAVVRIGTLTVSGFGDTWHERRFAWHGDNRMERLNLPTGFTYAHTAILFRRSERGFEIEAEPWDSSPSIAWQKASQRANALYRVSSRPHQKARYCGLF
jgi:HKD family nuclease